MRMICTWLPILLLASPASAQPPDAGKYSEEKFAVKASRGHKVKMRDGVALSVDLYRPDADGTFPAILYHTPYNNNLAGWTNRAKWFAKRGYVVAISDCRGRFDSDGEWDPFDRKHKTDGYDLVEWAAKEPWCTGKVGMVGPSYMGWTQWWTATQAPPSLKAIVPEVAPPDHFANAPYQHGVLTGWLMDWGATMAGRTAQIVGEGGYGGFTPTRAADFMKLPYVKLNERRGAMDSPWFETWITKNLSTDDYWKGIAYQTKEAYSKVSVPSLAITGWFDANYPGSPMNYLGVKKYGATPEARRPSLVIGPWQHSFNKRKVGEADFGPTAVIDWDGYACRWFDHYLKGIENGVAKDPPVHVFVMGANRWRAETDWPLPQTQWVKYYLHSKGKANTLDGDGTLSTVPPKAEPADSYTYNPAKPTLAPFTGGHLEDGPVDTRKTSAGLDVLVYYTPPLSEDVEIVGPIEAKLFATTSAKDTDWMVRLIDVAPDGRAGLLCDGVIRARCRDPQNGGIFNSEKLSTIEPEKAYEYTIRFWRGTGNVFKKGHRIRVEVSSSYFPYYLRNLNTGADNVGLETEFVVAKQKIHHDAERPSHIVLPVIPVK
ncbi:MAG: CocE/NonD family hydrolase [Planctomycetes bacterium]|nr:CocE/NonD family hydrolase [Planctomycetota bacterium]